MSGIFCKALHSNPFLAGNILQHKTEAASKQHRFQIFQPFTFICQILPQGRSSRTQPGGSVKSCYHVLLWGKNYSSLEGDATHLQSFPHRFTAVSTCNLLLKWTVASSLKNMHIPSREELHLKEQSTSSTSTNLYCEDGTALDQPTDFTVKPRST